MAAASRCMMRFHYRSARPRHWGAGLIPLAMVAAEASIGRRRLLRMLVGLGIGTITGGGAWGYFYERYRLELTRADVPVTNLPPALEGLKVAMLTDIHRSSTVPERLVREAVQLALQSQPDLIVLAGDYV